MSKSYHVKLHSGNNRISATAESGENLLNLIQKHVNNFHAPCGGNGTCGKCRVHILNEDYVTACLYPITKDIEVVLPDVLEMEILVSQHKFISEVISSPGNSLDLAKSPLGVAIDIGTTSIVLYLVDLKTNALLDIYSTANPQIKYGADVISRINYSVTNRNGLFTIQKSVIDCLNHYIKLFVKKTKSSFNSIVRISIVGNPAMMHILLGIDPLPIALAPFTPSFTELKNVHSQTLGLKCHRESEIFILPSISGYIGADIVAGIASINMVDTNSSFLFIDIGTNGEIALITPSIIWCCATAAGPAFEGANIKHGMGAFPGAISHFSSEGLKSIDNSRPIGICGSGLVDILSYMLNNNIMSQDGNIEDEFLVSQKINNGIDQDIVVTQQDIREVQLAKSAIASGIKILLNTANINLSDLDAIFIAGGFGNYINIESAKNIGLLPKEFENIIQVGNTAGTGAVLALKSEDFITKTEKIKSKSKYVELATNDEFALEFAMNMMF
jgi:uncharacterized 2Fe-2S/4Fe-4S cluster protein (DUF4445 family)